MKIDAHSATYVAEAEHLQMEDTGDSCRLEFFERDLHARDTDDSCATESLGGDWSAEVKQENLPVLKQESDSDIVCCHFCCIQFFAAETPFFIPTQPVVKNNSFISDLRLLVLPYFDTVGWALGRGSELKNEC